MQSSNIQMLYDKSNVSHTFTPFLFIAFSSHFLQVLTTCKQQTIKVDVFCVYVYVSRHAMYELVCLCVADWDLMYVKTKNYVIKKNKKNNDFFSEDIRFKFP